MIIDVLQINADGTQELVQKEVPEDYYATPTPQPTPEDILLQRIATLEATVTSLIQASPLSLEGKGILIDNMTVSTEEV